MNLPDQRVRTVSAGERTQPTRSDQGRRVAGIGVAGVAIAALVLSWLVWSTTPAARSDGAVRPDGPPIVDPTVPDAASAGSQLSMVVSLPREGLVAESPLGRRIPGFTDTITMLMWSNAGVDVLRWPVSQSTPHTMASLGHAAGWNRSVDSSGRWLVEISVGSAIAVRAVDGSDAAPEAGPALGATNTSDSWSAAWHDTRPGVLAWLDCVAGDADSPVTLHTVDVGDSAAAAVVQPLVGFPCGGSGVRLAQWGDWGVLLQVTVPSGTEHVLLDVGRSELARGRLGREGEWFVGAGPNGATVWTEGPDRPGASSFLLSADGLDRGPVPGLQLGERLEHAVLSPDGLRLALVLDLTAHFGSLVRIVDVDGGSTVAEIAQPDWWATKLAWSSDASFVLYERWLDVPSNWAGVPRDVELVFFDLESDSGLAIPIPGYAAALRSAP